MTLELQLPLSPQDVQALSVGQLVSLQGMLFTGREPVHKHLYEGGTPPAEVRGSVLYHCGPQVRRVGSKWEVLAAAPENSSNLETYIGELFGRFGFAGVMGRGGASRTTLNACRRYGGVYLQTIGGAALALAQRIESAKTPHFKDEFDSRDAMWELEVSGFPAVVTVDAHGRSLPDIVRDVSSRRFLSIVD